MNLNMIRMSTIINNMINRTGKEYYVGEENYINNHFMSFRNLKSKNRIELSDMNLDDIGVLDYTRSVLSSYGDLLDIPFRLILDDFVIKYKCGDISVYLHVHKSTEPFISERFICIDEYLFTYEDKLHKRAASTLYIDMADVTVQNMMNWFHDDNPTSVFDIRVLSSLCQDRPGHVSVCFLKDMITKSNYNFLIGGKTDWSIVNKLIDEMTSVSYRLTVLCLFVFSINFELQCELATRPIIKSVPRNKTEKTITQTEKRNTDNGRKIINVNNMVIRFSDNKSYKDFQTKVRRKCDYQYSVTGHFRHYKKSGKTIYINPYNKNKDKPFKGKTYIISEKKEAAE